MIPIYMCISKFEHVSGIPEFVVSLQIQLPNRAPDAAFAIAGPLSGQAKLE